METFLHVRYEGWSTGMVVIISIFFFFVKRVPFFNKFRQLSHSFTHNQLFVLFVLKLFYFQKYYEEENTSSRPTWSFTTRCAWQWHWWCQWNWKIYVKKCEIWWENNFSASSSSFFLRYFFGIDIPSKVRILFPKNVVRSSIMGMFATWSHDQLFLGQLFASLQDFCEFEHAWKDWFMYCFSLNYLL